ncbi:cadherin-like domain-containing protein [Pseudoscourfieldia marina]
MSPGGVPLAQTQTGTLPWQYGFVTITPLCTDTSCSSVTVDGKVSGGHNVESPLVPVNGELNFLPGSSSIAVFVKPHDSTAPAKGYYMKLSRGRTHARGLQHSEGVDAPPGAVLDS